MEVVKVNLGEPTLYTPASGIKGPIYCDIRRLISYPGKREEIVNALIKTIDENHLEFDVVGGVSTAGIPWAAWIAAGLEKPMVYIRPESKGYGTGKQVEGDLYKRQRVLIVEDVVSTGKSAFSTIVAARNKGGIVTDCICVLSYDFEHSVDNFSGAGVNLHPLVGFMELVEAAKERNLINDRDLEDIMKWHEDPEVHR